MSSATFHQVIILALLLLGIVCAALRQGELATQLLAAAAIVFLYFADSTK